jgi:hypothetical protein
VKSADTKFGNDPILDERRPSTHEKSLCMFSRAPADSMFAALYPLGSKTVNGIKQFGLR